MMLKDTQDVQVQAQAWMNPAIDRTGWGEGDWSGEPDKVQWTDTATGLACLARRHPVLGHWCGFVGVPPGHPLHGIHAHDLPYLEVHGAVTEALHDAGDDACERDTWWLGFRCSHTWDFSPGIAAMLRTLPLRTGKVRLPGPGQLPAQRDVYRTLAYVRAQCARLAAQVAALKAGA